MVTHAVAFKIGDPYLLYSFARTVEILVCQELSGTLVV